MRITLGELAAHFRVLVEAAEAVDRCEKAITFGGSPWTMQAKQSQLEHAQRMYEALLETVIFDSASDDANGSTPRPRDELHDKAISTNPEHSMSIEKIIAENTAAMVALTAALVAGAKVGTTSTGSGSTAGASTTTTASGPTREQVTAALEKVQADKGKDAAKAIVKATGAGKMAEIKESDFAKVLAACEAAIADDGGL